MGHKQTGCEGIDCSYVVRKGIKLLELVNMAMKLQVAKNAGNFLDS